MNLVELNRALRQLRLGGMAAVLETRLRQAQAESVAPLDLISCLVADELIRPERLRYTAVERVKSRDTDRRSKPGTVRENGATISPFLSCPELISDECSGWRRRDAMLCIAVPCRAALRCAEALRRERFPLGGFLQGEVANRAYNSSRQSTG